MAGTQVHPVWKKLWNLKVPAKCVTCPAQVEDLRHVLFTCSRAKAVWSALGAGELIAQSLALDRAGSAVLEDLLAGDHASKIYMTPVTFGELCAVACWYIWWERRQLMHGEPIPPPDTTAFSIQALVMNYVRSYSKQSGIQRLGWQKPPEGMQKLNVDASFIEDKEEGATGAVIRDASGLFVRASNSCIPIVYDATMAEAMALWNGIQFAKSLGCSNLLISSDSLEVVQEMNSDSWPSPAAAIYIDCVEALKEFGKVITEHCPGEANQVAHELARIARDDPPNVWLDNPPNFLIPLLVDNVTLI
ncbi:uncharacterized protein LOC112271019 [Brachypodium distachyon]|uniref:RNase H type-1 domain-containing protein n=1 Tax=Brachypodium distachyon TaxID=15368 RepID=A0A0Q3GGJ7_BRADI|nr:uncharacterized protein LOC112271019 [Brachypodium distachyon]KQK10208.2 hypothetical protein BRADI_2g53033v3 [Brachypodium distachyon]|eukprot:XP_024315667.1 uncharacterized protein LOC112271019 [Brachypodium distachyon]